MSNQIFEDLPAPAKKAAPPKGNPSAENSPQGQGGPGGNAQEGSEKKVRQAVYDIRYRARREEIPLLQAFNQYMSHTSMTGPEKAAVKEKLGEAYEMNQLASSNVANAMFKVFVEGVETDYEPISNDYLNQLMEMEDKKYKVRVTDKNSGKSYVRMATREKINSLRANPNISSVEMTQYGSPYEGERRGGEQTARAKAGKGLDPVGKEDADVDNDGKKNDPNDKYIMKRRAAVGSAIEKRKTVSASYEPEGEIVTEVKSTSKQNKKKITGEGVNNYGGGKGSVVKLFPDDGLDSVDRAGQSGSMSIKAGYEMNGVFINEKALSQSQQKFLNMVQEKMDLAKADMGDVVKDFQTSDAPQFKGKSKKKRQQMAVAAKLGAERQSGMREECGMDEKPKLKKSEGGVEDPRAIPTKMNLVKNKLRSMGLKMSYEPESEMVEARYYGRRGPDRNAVGGADRNGGRNRYLGSPTPEQEADERKRGDEAASKAVAQLRRRRAAEEARKNRG